MMYFDHNALSALKKRVTGKEFQLNEFTNKELSHHSCNHGTIMLCGKRIPFCYLGTGWNCYKWSDIQHVFEGN